MAINIIAAVDRGAGHCLVFAGWADATGRARARMGALVWGSHGLAGIPWLGPVLGEGLLGHGLLVYLALALVPLSWWVLFRNALGLRLRAVRGEPADGGCGRRVGHAAAVCSPRGERHPCAVSLAVTWCWRKAPAFPYMTAGRGFMALRH